MKNFLYIIFSTFLISQNQSSMNALENILQTPEVVEYFNGMFNKLGIAIDETDEKFTINHDGEKLSFLRFK